MEVNSSRLDAQFAVSFLKSGVAALLVANTLGTINRDDVHRCGIHRLPLSERRRYGDAFRQLAQLDATLQALAAARAKIIVLHFPGWAVLGSNQ